MTLETGGLLTTNTVEDEAWFGYHTVTFLGYMPDLDPSGLYTYPIKLSIEILIRDPAALIDPDVAAHILGKNTRRPPVSIQGMESLFFGNFNETTTF